MTQFNAIKALQIFIAICFIFNYCHSGALPAAQVTEQSLITSLLSGYNKNVRPDTTVNVVMTASILQIISIDEKQQIMTSSLYVSQYWTDNRFSWTPSSNGNLQVVMLPVKSIWIPDTIILNSADTSGYFSVSDYSLASVYYDGSVFMIIPALTIKTRCNFNVQMFPFDRQMCSINITSWAQGINRVAYAESSNDVVDTTKYTAHPIWQLNGTDVVVLQDGDRVPFEDTYNAIISIQLYLQRKPLFFILNGIFACFVLNCVTLLSFALQFGSQVGLCMTCFMTFSVYSLNFANMFPQQSDYIMMITLYFLLSIAWTAVSLLWFVFYNTYTSKGEMPKLLDSLAVCLQTRCACCSSSGKDDKKKDANLENGDFTKFEDTNMTNTNNLESESCTCCQEVFSCCRRKAKVENSFQVFVMPNRLSPMQTKSGGNNLIQAETIASERTTEEKEKEKCNFCRRCESCQSDVDKDKDKGKKKKEVEAKCNALNYFFFVWIFIFMLISDVTIWTLMAV